MINIIFISLIIPIIISSIIIIKKNVEVKIFILGLLTFFVPQVLIRIPILEYINFSYLNLQHYFIYKIIVPMTAGLVEVVADYLIFLLLKNINFYSALIVGIAHTVCENIFIIITSINIFFTSYDLSYWTSIERLFALIAHISFALFAYYSIKKDNLIYLYLGIFLHGISDMVIFFIHDIMFNEIFVAIIAILSLIFILNKIISAKII